MPAHVSDRFKQPEAASNLIKVTYPIGEVHHRKAVHPVVERVLAVLAAHSRSKILQRLHRYLLQEAHILQAHTMNRNEGPQSSSACLHNSSFHLRTWNINITNASSSSGEYWNTLKLRSCRSARLPELGSSVSGIGIVAGNEGRLIVSLRSTVKLADTLRADYNQRRAGEHQVQ